MNKLGGTIVDWQQVKRQNRHCAGRIGCVGGATARRVPLRIGRSGDHCSSARSPYCLRLPRECACLLITGGGSPPMTTCTDLGASGRASCRLSVGSSVSLTGASPARSAPGLAA